MTKPSLNHPAPDFDLPATNNNTIKLSELKGKNVVLYFYPKDGTPGCTLEGKNFRDSFHKFAELNTVILGISRDDLNLHHKFKAEHEFPFDLVSDSNQTACKLYDVIKQKNMYGKKVFGVERSTFLIDTNGILRKEWRKVKIENHVEELLQAIQDLETKS